MRLAFDLDEMEKIPIIPQKDKEGKGWSYSYVYYLRNLKDIYSVLCLYGGVRSIPQLLAICKTNDVQTENGKEWNGRYLLEFVNALKNFGLIDTSNNPLKENLFESGLNEPLTTRDKNVFVNIYSSYFRFQEFHNLFGGFSNTPNSLLVYAYMDNCRFYNHFVCAEKNTVFYIENQHQDMMRFWDVYTKWGTTLQVLNKCSLASLEISSPNEELKNAYLLNLSVPVPENFSILDYVTNVLNSKYIYIPALERELVIEYKFSIESIKEKLVFETNKRSNEFRLQRTSEMLVDGNTKSLLPYVENVLMSHLIKL
ncbi:MAG: hypothetical protein IKM85_06440 [Bacteroidales bacterium]|nr:hypothetical protein [Bacteroidales bacterium]